MGEFELKSSQFRSEREASWRELELLVERIEHRGARQVDPEDLARLPTLYRSAASSLSVARAISLDKALLDYLESLVGRAYLTVYGAKRSPAEAVLEFVGYRFPATVRRYGLHLAVSVGILCLGVLCGGLLTRADEHWFYGLVPTEMAQGCNPSASTESLREILYFEPDSEGETRVHAMLNVFASFLFTHNAKIGILCFALGFAAAAPTVFLLFSNGLMLGAMATLYASRGLGPEFWAWVLPHGVTELLGVCLCGMAGLVIGMALVFPGERSRLEHLSDRGREMALVVIGAVVMFFLAALIEGFFRQLVHDPAIRWVVAVGTALAWLAYFTGMGRRRERSGTR
jgi:uncharacterized membrane protein SpoIIM required for sporulation